MRDRLNILDELIAINSSLGTPRPHASGRREFRQEQYARGITIHHRDRSEKEVLRAVAEGRQPRPTGTTLPIQRQDEGGKNRKERKQGKMSARQQRRARKVRQQVEKRQG